MRGADSAGSGREGFAGHGVLRFEEQYHIGSSGENRPDIESYVCEGKSQADYIPVVEATVYLEGDEKKIPFAYKGGDLWETEAMFIKSGVEYVLKIEIPGRGLISG